MTIPVAINKRILMLAIGVNRLDISFINLFTIGADSKVAFALGNITKRIIAIPPIHTTVAKRWRTWLKLNINRITLFLHFVSRDIRSKGAEVLIYWTPPP